MAYTTVTAIREAIEDVVQGLTTSGKVYGSGDRYTLANPKEDWGERPDVDMDRRFTVGYIERGEPQMFGAVGEIDYDGEFVITIAHAKSHDKQDALDRMNTDVAQICQEVERTSSLPSGVSMIRYESHTMSEEDGFFVTELQFRILFTLQIS